MPKIIAKQHKNKSPVKKTVKKVTKASKTKAKSPKKSAGKKSTFAAPYNRTITGYRSPTDQFQMNDKYNSW